MAKMIPPPLLTKLELRAITGLAQKSRQVKWLKERRIPHTLNAFREPLVLREQLIVCYGGLGSLPRKPKRERTEPNWAAIGL
ncbi:DUF4224 domain-containing protein [Aquabacterium soli]|nr:DUF4224 domain-containing protein [Aquabacterium soli]